MSGTCPSNLKGKERQQKSRLTSNPGCVDLATNSRGPFRVTAEFLPVVVTAQQFLRFHLQTCVTIVTVVDVVVDVVGSFPKPSQTSRGLSQGSRVARATECGVFRDVASGTARHCGGLREDWKTTNTWFPYRLTQNEALSASVESTNTLFPYSLTQTRPKGQCRIKKFPFQPGSHFLLTRAVQTEQQTFQIPGIASTAGSMSSCYCLIV